MALFVVLGEKGQIIGYFLPHVSKKNTILSLKIYKKTNLSGETLILRSKFQN